MSRTLSIDFLRTLAAIADAGTFAAAAERVGRSVSAVSLQIDRLEEQPFLEWPADFLVESEPGSGVYVLPEGPGELPLMFSLLASKPA